MPKSRIILEVGQLIEVCIRLKEGLPFTGAPFITDMLEGVLAKAQHLYPVQIGNFTVLGNHVHMHLTVQNIDDVAGFKQHFKTNSSKIVNQMLGTTGSIWEEGSDAPVVLDKKKLVNRLVYFFMNPQRAGLVDSIDDYPALCTWKYFISGTSRVVKEARLPYITRVPQLPNKRLNRREVAYYTDLMKEATWDTNLLTILPRGSFETLGCSEEETDELMLEVIERVREEEQKLKRQRQRRGEKTIGRLGLILANPHKPWVPTKRGRRMLCLGSCKKARAAYINKHRRWSRRCREIYQQWCVGNFIPLPAFVYPPRMPCVVHLVEKFTPS